MLARDITSLNLITRLAIDALGRLFVSIFFWPNGLKECQVACKTRTRQQKGKDEKKRMHTAYELNREVTHTRRSEFNSLDSKVKLEPKASSASAHFDFRV